MDFVVMRKSRFIAENIIRILEQAEADVTVDECTGNTIPVATFYSRAAILAG